MPDDTVLNPQTTSSDYDAMSEYWDKVEAMLGGVDAMIDAGETHLPKFPEETQVDYDLRLASAVLTNIYKDVTENLAQKPFSKKVRFAEGKASTEITKLGEDIDGRGNNLHVFLGETFWKGINNAIDWILVDKMPMRPGVTIAEERLAGARPYWVHIPATKMLAVYSDIIDGKEQIVHARIHEPVIKRDGWGEIYLNRVRIFDRPLDPVTNRYGSAVWELWEEKEALAGKGTQGAQTSTWEKINIGTISIGIIALVPFVTGRRHGTSWVFDPPMRECLNAQFDHYQQENGKKDARIMTAYPMLSASGVTQAKDSRDNPVRVPVGPRGVLFAPMLDGKAGSWQWIEPQATSLSWLSSELKAKEDQIRELGRQPLTAQSGNLTVIMAGVAAAKGNSAVQAWTWALKDAAEQAMIYTSMYMGQGEGKTEVVIHTDFPVEGTAEKAPDIILKLRDMKEISRPAMFNELKRFSLISPDYDEKADEELIAEEAPSDPTAQDLAAALGNPNILPGPGARRPPPGSGAGG